MIVLAAPPAGAAITIPDVADWIAKMDESVSEQVNQ